jgi:hypothetical protein
VALIEESGIVEETFGSDPTYIYHICLTRLLSPSDYGANPLEGDES